VVGVGGGCSRKSGNTEQSWPRAPDGGVGSGGTLLGPEGMTCVVVVWDGQWPASRVFGVRALVRVVVENCTVDASIFCFCSVFVS